MRTQTVPQVDLFLSYNRQDEEAVFEVKRLLEMRGLRTFLDRETLVAGLPWPQALEEGLRAASAVAVFLGPHGLGRWQKREMYFALDRQAQSEGESRKFPVIPVLLQDAELSAGFLFLNTWVDLRKNLSETEAIDSLVQAVTANCEASAGEEVSAVCPYRDLRAFREEDAAFYFGREDFAGALLDKTGATLAATGRPRLVAVVGPSGSGKSSVVLAGLLPRLRRQRPPQRTWDAVWFTPGERPWRRMADALIPLLEPGLSETRRLEEGGALANVLASGGAALQSAVERILKKSGGTDRLLVVVDQFEELFTLTPQKERAPFVRALLEAGQNSPMTLLLTLRGDFYGRAIAADRNLSDALSAGQVNLGPMKQEELRAAIVEPARRVGLNFEPGLVDRILEDVGDEPGNLPLLQFALTELWNRRSGNKLTFDAYTKSGQVMGAIAERAETVFAKFSAAEQKRARSLFTRLVRVARASEEGSDTRRRARRGELGEDAWKLVEVFAGQENRLLVASVDPVTGEDTAEVAHEALIRNWKRLRDWIEEDREFLLWRQQLRLYLSAWQASQKKDEGSLLRGAVFTEARRWLRSRGQELNPLEREFIEKSGKAVRVSKLAARSALALAGLILLAALGWFFYTRTDTYQIKTILTPELESQILTSGESYVRAYTAALIITGKGDEAEQITLRVPDPHQRLRTLIAVAGALRDTGQTQEAANLLRQAEQIALEITDSADRSAALIPVAGSLARTGQTEEATQVALRIPEPEDQCSALIHIARTLAERGDSAEADKLLEQAVHIALGMPGMMKRSDSLVALYEALLQRGKNDEAGNLLEQVQQIIPQVSDPGDRWHILDAIADSVVKTGQGKEASDLLQQAGEAALQIEDFDERVDALISTTELLAKAGKADDARRLALQIQDAPGRSRALSSVTGALARTDRVDEAQEIAALQISNPDYVVDILGPVIQALTERGRIEEARQVVLRQTQDNQLQSRLFSVLARSLAAAGKVDEAERIVLQIQGPAFERALALSAVAIASAKAGKGAEARKLLEDAKEAALGVDKRLFRSQALLTVSRALATLRLFREARLTADLISVPNRKFSAYAYILIEYAKQKNPKLTEILEVEQ